MVASSPALLATVVRTLSPVSIPYCWVAVAPKTLFE